MEAHLKPKKADRVQQIFQRYHYSWNINYTQVAKTDSKFEIFSSAVRFMSVESNIEKLEHNKY